MPRDTQHDASRMERERMQEVTDRIENRKPRPLVYALSQLLITLSYAIVASLILSLIVEAFTLGGEVVLRSLAAATLPPLLISYFAIFHRSSRRPPIHFPRFGLYLVATLWMLAMLILIGYLSEQFEYGISLGILILSATLSALIFLNKRIPFASALSCSFGIVTGLLVYALLFGFPS